MRRIVQLIIAIWVADLVLALAYLAVETELLTWAYWEQGKRSEILRNLGLLVAAVVGVGFAIWRAITGHLQAKASLAQARTAESGHITDRFTRAIDQLGSEQLPVRLGAIYALWRLAEDWPDQFTTTVVDVLCAFARNPPHPEQVGVEARADVDIDDNSPAVPVVRPDVQAILDLIGAKSAKYRELLPDGYRLNLSGAFLRRAQLADTKLDRAIFDDANLTQAQLRGADLEGTRFSFANLTGAHLDDACLIGARFLQSDLSLASCEGADFWHCFMLETKLTNARLQRANLSSAIFVGVYFEDADLAFANLTFADLKVVDGLTQAQLDSACITGDDAPPSLASGLRPPTRICGQKN